MILFNPFEIKSVHTGIDFSILLIQERENVNYATTTSVEVPASHNEQQVEYQDDEEQEFDEEGEPLEDVSEYPEAEDNLDINQKDPLFHIFRMIVFLYEDLRYKLIKIIDENMNIDEALSEDYIELIKNQQDIID